MGKMVGIDLGTTNTVVAIIDGPRPRVLDSQEGKPQIRSAVSLKKRKGRKGEAGTEEVLVGDAAANVMAGYETTVPITLDMMIYHARSVARAVRRALMPVEVPDIIIFLPELPLNDRGKVDRHQLERVILKETATKACD